MGAYVQRAIDAANAEKDAQIARLRERVKVLEVALGELFAVVQGECPSLLNEDSGGDAELCITIEEALNQKGGEPVAEVEHINPLSNTVLRQHNRVAELTAEVERQKDLNYKLTDEVERCREEIENAKSALGEHPDSLVDLAQRISDIRDEGREHFHTVTRLQERMSELEKTQNAL